MVKVIRAFCWHQKFVPKGFSALAPGLYTSIKSLKMCIESDLEEIILKLETYGQREKAFLLSSKFCRQGVVCPCPGSVYIYKSIKIYTRTRCQVSVYRTTGPLVFYNEELIWFFCICYKFSNSLSEREVPQKYNQKQEKEKKNAVYAYIFSNVFFFAP